MKPFQKATHDPAQERVIVQDTLRHMRQPGNESEVRLLFNLTDDEPLPAAGEIERAVKAFVRKSFDLPVYVNDVYQVVVEHHDLQAGFPPMIHLSIKRIDKGPFRDWRDFQEIKNLLVGPEHEAVELYPAESRKVDAANQYHVWVLAEKGVRFPFGMLLDSNRPFVTEATIAGSKQRPFVKEAI